MKQTIFIKTHSVHPPTHLKKNTQYLFNYRVISSSPCVSGDIKLFLQYFELLADLKINVYTNDSS